MRIGIDARFYGTVGKGLGRYTEKLIQELERIDCENDYVVFLCPENYEAYVPKNPRFSKVLSRSKWYGFSEQFFFPFLLYRFRLDLVHFPHFNVPLLYRKPLVFTLHDLILFHYPTKKATTRSPFLYRMKFLSYRLVLSAALRRAKAVITVSHFTEADIKENYPSAASKICVTYEAAEDRCFVLPEEEENTLFRKIGLPVSSAPLQGGKRDILEPYVLYVGNAYPHKNLGMILEMAEKFPGERFVLVGKEDYFYARLKKEALARGVGNVVFAGSVSDEELGTLYRHARLYLFPSLYEGFGLPPLEAMNYGVPVMSARRGSLPEVLGDAAHYFDPEDKEAAEKIFTKMLTDESLRERLRARGYAQSAKYSWKRMAEETLRLYTRKNTHETCTRIRIGRRNA
ncbi:MAG: hypothetical protein A2808_00900 [Candidatus Moranbacteria bacterium RIFCSPHIGHO2_01_FULL_55_24]|nr:MAG: hypothetical protein A2808_00900 [Candidatus Moranbacteria bacterium RIFCSPHIGHO2_01_FULL_55_24]